MSREVLSKVSGTPTVRILLYVAFLLAVVGASAAADVASLQAAIDTATAGVREHAMVGLMVRSLTRGDTLCERDAGHVFNPASNEKLLTSAAALDRLGPDHRFGTRVLAAGTLRADGSLLGDLVLQGGGDPVLLTADLEELARKVVEAGVRRVTGALRADDSRFDAERLRPTWAVGDEPFYYSAQISALTLNRNTVTLRVTPAARRGWPARVTLDPPTATIHLLNRCVTSPPAGRADVQVARTRARNDVTVDGSIPAGNAPVEERVTVEQPALYAGAIFRDALRRSGVAIDGPVVWLRAPISARALATHDSPPLADILLSLNKPSDNLIAEILLKTLGAERRGAGTAPAGAEEVIAFLREAGLALDPTVIRDGSGLSRHDLVSPRTLCGLLEFMSRHRDAAAFERSLPISGVDGTLRRRMQDSPAANIIHAKTGSLTHVSALSGYVTARGGETLVFSLITNNFPGPSDTLKRMEDEVGRALAEFSR